MRKMVGFPKDHRNSQRTGSPGWKILLMVLLLSVATTAQGATRLKCIKLAITNPTGQNRPDADIVLSISKLRKIAPDFYAGSQIVTATDASTLEEDAATEQATQLPSQVDALDGNSQPDDLAFQINLGPHQTRIVTITYGPPDLIFKLRGDYPPGTNAIFSRKIEGMGWESKRIAYRLYFDKRNAIDIFGKKRPMLLLDRFATPGYVYHNASPDGRDIFMVGDSLGIGSVGGWVNGAAARVADVADRKWRIISTGPVRAIVEFTYRGWKVGGRTITLKSRIVQWAGERGFTQSITSSDAGDFPFVTGFARRADIPDLRSRPGAATPWLATWGQQVVEPANQAIAPILKGSDLGLAVIMAPGTDASPAKDKANYLLKFALKNQTASWYAMAAWDKEASNNPLPTSTSTNPMTDINFIASGQAIKTQKQFMAAIHNKILRMEHPVIVKFLSSAPQTQSAPPDTLHPIARRSYSEAIELLEKEIDRTARKWAPVITASNPRTFGPSNGDGFFTEASDKTGEWKPQKGFSWTGGFWTGELWKMYEITHNPKYLHWAELWTSRLIGHELTGDHDVGFLYYYSAVPGYRLTHKAKYRASAMRAAFRLDTMFNPITQMIPAWGPGGDDSIIDTMMNLQILWWASDETGDPTYRELALKHALRAAKWLVRKNGSTIQSVQYNPGDDRQRFRLSGDHFISVPNHAAPGHRVFDNTHQGYAWNTTWSRGEAWALYGFAVAYRETHDPRMLATAEKVAHYVLANLPEDGVTWYDFNDPGVIYRNRDSSAAAIIADGLLRLSKVEPNAQKAALYRRECERITQSLIDRYLTPTYSGDPTPPGVLRHGCYTHPSDEALIYGQYYLLDTLTALEEQKAKGSTATQ